MFLVGLDSKLYPSHSEKRQDSYVTSALVQPVDKTGLGRDEHGRFGRRGPQGR